MACAPLGYGAEVILANGDRYIGEVVDGVLSGKGAYIWAVGDRYEGISPMISPMASVHTRG